MAWDRFAKVFDFESALETRCEEAAEGGNKGGEGGKDQDVELDRCDVDDRGDAGGKYCEPSGELIGV